MTCACTPGEGGVQGGVDPLVPHPSPPSPHMWEQRHEYQDGTTARYRCEVCGCWGYRRWPRKGRPLPPIAAYAGPVDDDEAAARWADRARAWVTPAHGGIRRGHGPDDAPPHLRGMR